MTKLRCHLGLHSRSPGDRHREADGLYRSVCRRCGIGMVRERRSGRWLPMQDRDRRRRTRWIRRALHRLTGPVLFLLLLGAALGAALLLRAPAGRAPASPLAAGARHGQ